MSERILIRIFRLKASSGKVEPLSIPNSQYILHHTVDDIKFEPSSTSVAGSIKLDSGDIPSEDPKNYAKEWVGVKYVYKDDEKNKYYILIRGNRYYLTGNISASSDLQKEEDIPDVFEFYVNPEKITPMYKKLVTEIRTRGGWDVQHWGEALPEIRVQGRSGGMHNIEKGKDVMQSTAWKRLMQLKKLYDTDHSITNKPEEFLLGFNFYDKFFIGYFTDFVGPEADRDHPYIVNYSFTFKVQQEISASSFLS